MPNPPPSGYSGPPLAKKLGIAQNSLVVLINAPENYLTLVTPLPEGVKFSTRLSNTSDIIHIFTTKRAELEKLFADCRQKLKPTGVIWVSWPKKTAKMPTEVTENVIRELALPMGFVDIKVCAIDETWSGLKIVLRKELR